MGADEGAGGAAPERKAGTTAERREGCPSEEVVDAVMSDGSRTARVRSWTANIWGREGVHQPDGTIVASSLDRSDGTARRRWPFTEPNGRERYQGYEPCNRNSNSVVMKKVLVVEDDPFVREMAVAGLEDAGFEAIAAASGSQALEFLLAGIAIDALLTDIRLPGADGWAVARAYRERFPDLPVLYVTGFAEQMQPVAGGIILAKPYRMAQVIGVLEPWTA